MNLFGDSDYLEKLSSKGDPLERLEKVVDFECFRSTLNRIFKYDLKNKYLNTSDYVSLLVCFSPRASGSKPLSRCHVLFWTIFSLS